MCEPTTMMALAATAATVGKGVEALGSYQQANYEAGVASNNAVVAQAQAADAVERGQQDLLRHYQRVAQLKGTQRAAMGANGVEMGFGSALGIETDTAMLAERDADTIHANYAREKYGHTVTAQNFRAQASAAKSRGRSALVKGVFDMVGTAMGGASQVAGAQAQFGSGGARSPVYSGSQVSYEGG